MSQCYICGQFCQLSHLVLCTSGFSLCINGTKSVVSAPTYRIYSAEGCHDIRKVFYLAHYHCSAGYNVPIRLQGHTIWLVLKVLLPGFPNQCLRSAKKGHGFPNLQFSDSSLAKLGVFTDYHIPWRGTAVFYMMADFCKLVQSGLHKFFRKTQQQHCNRAKYGSIDLIVFVW